MFKGQILTNQTDHVKSGVGQDGGIDLVQAVVGSFSAAQCLSGHADHTQNTHTICFD